MWSNVAKEVSSEDVKRLLKKAVERGVLLERDLSDLERMIASRLYESGVLERAYLVSTEYLNDVIKFVRPRVVVRRGARHAVDAISYLIFALIMLVPTYITVLSLILGNITAFLFFALITAGIAYAVLNHLVPRIRRRLMLRLGVA